MALPFGFELWEALFLAAALFGAAVIRGISGFGFSAIFIICAALITNPVPLIPVVFACEIGMTAFQARGIRPHIDWSRATALLVGAALATVPAVTVMAQLGETAARLVISGLVLCLALLLLSGWQLTRPVGTAGHVGIGAVSGFANGAGVGGLPTAALLSAQALPPAIFRATMIVFLTGIDLFALPVMAAHGLTSGDTVIGVLMAFPILGAGVWLGTRAFHSLSQARFRIGVVSLLAGLAALNLLRSIL